MQIVCYSAPGGFNAAGKEEVKLYVGNLSFDTPECDVRSMFEECGAVSDCFMPTDCDTGKVRGFCFVTMPAADAEVAVTKLNGQYLDGRPLRVIKAQPRGGADGEDEQETEEQETDEQETDEEEEDMKREYLGLESEEEFQCSLADYRKHFSPCYGNRNPQRLDNPFWQDMIKLGWSAYSAKCRFGDDSYESYMERSLVWSYQRMGASLTELQDGRFVQIGGEHEDSYDPDFYIYNDVVIHDGKGKGKFEIYGYPQEAFPPTDFHSATLVGEWIYIIGCIGYPQQRQEGRTPVYRLKVPSWEIEEVETSGEIPSWLHKHRSNYEAERHVIRINGGKQFAADEDDELQIIRNTESFELDLSSFRWRKLK